MTAPDVTICIPAYRSQDFVHRAIESALGQENADIRVVVSVDPADDGTEAVCQRYASGFKGKRQRQSAPPRLDRKCQRMPRAS